MTTPATPSDPKTAEIAITPEERLRLAWDRYGNMIYFACGVIAVGILAKGGLDYVNAQKELGIQREFAECTSTDSFRAFVNNRPGHPLTGVAEVTIADSSYASGKYADAAAAYSSAVADLPAGPVKAHAQLGMAMSLEMSGKTSEAEAGLRQILNDTTQLKTVRCEAGYHMAGIALAAGRGSEVQKLAEQLMQIDPSSPFAERAFALRPPAAPVAAVKP